MNAFNHLYQNLPQVLLLSQRINLLDYNLKNYNLMQLGVLLIQQRNCDDLNNEMPCLKCKHCILLLNNNHPDIIIISDTTDIDSLLYHAIFAPVILSYKYCLIDLDLFNSTNANSLLKLLEDSKIFFILTTYQSFKILPTILSRAVKLQIPASYKILSDFKFHELVLHDNIYNKLNNKLSHYLTADIEDLLINTLAIPKVSIIFETITKLIKIKIPLKTILNFLLIWICDLTIFFYCKKVRYFHTKLASFIFLIQKVVIEKIFHFYDYICSFLNYKHDQLNLSLHLTNIFFQYQSCFI